MSKWVISNYGNDLSWIPKYTSDYIIYNQGEPIDDPKAIQVPHAGTDICDKFTFIIDNYENLPDVAIMVKANFLWRFTTYEEFDLIKDNKTFTPILTQKHKTYGDENGPICYYENGLYYERKGIWQWWKAPHYQELMNFFKHSENYYGFAPGSNYIVPKENILKHPKETYQKLKSYLDYHVYPLEGQIIERNLYDLWKL